MNERKAASLDNATIINRLYIIKNIADIAFHSDEEKIGVHTLQNIFNHVSGLLDNLIDELDV